MQQFHINQQLLCKYSIFTAIRLIEQQYFCNNKELLIITNNLTILRGGGQAFDSSQLRSGYIHVRLSVDLITRMRCTSSGYILSIHVINKVHFRTTFFSICSYRHQFMIHKRLSLRRNISSISSKKILKQMLQKLFPRQYYIRNGIFMISTYPSTQMCVIRVQRVKTKEKCGNQ